MSVLNILKYPDPFLKTKTKPVSKIDADIKRLISDMAETMYFAKGIGLAATQVGVDKRVMVLDIPKDEGYKRGENLIVLINTEITEYEREIKYEEGCLSIPGFTAEIKRFANIAVKGLNQDGNDVEMKAEGLLAIAIQHEIDHLDGLLFIDRLSKLKRDIIKRKIKKAALSEKKML